MIHLLESIAKMDKHTDLTPSTELPEPWWRSDASDFAQLFLGHVERAERDLDLTIATKFKPNSDDDPPTEHPALSIECGGAVLGWIVCFKTGYQVRWRSGGTRSAYMLWIGAMRGKWPPMYLDGDTIEFADLESAKLAAISFLRCFTSEASRRFLLPK